MNAAITCRPTRSSESESETEIERRRVAHPPPCARWPGTSGSRLAGHFLWVLVWTGACYWHGVGGLMFNSPSSERRRVAVLVPASPAWRDATSGAWCVGELRCKHVRAVRTWAAQTPQAKRVVWRTGSAGFEVWVTTGPLWGYPRGLFQVDPNPAPHGAGPRKTEIGGIHGRRSKRQLDVGDLRQPRVAAAIRRRSVPQRRRAARGRAWRRRAARWRGVVRLAGRARRVRRREQTQ